jgi:hypothetical protein
MSPLLIIIFLDCIFPEINFGENCANAFPDANLDPSQPLEAQAFCQNNMFFDGQVLINSSGAFGKIKICLFINIVWNVKF